jgi:branched-subunit amino acid transport protein
MIEPKYFLVCTVLLAIGTFAIRYSFVAIAGRLKLGPETRQLFTYIPAAIFPALTIPATFFHQGQVAAFMGKERFLVLIIAAVACYFVRNTLFIVALGLGLLYLVIAN